MTLDDLGDQGGVGESHSLERLGVLFFFHKSAICNPVEREIGLQE